MFNYINKKNGFYYQSMFFFFIYSITLQQITYLVIHLYAFLQALCWLLEFVKACYIWGNLDLYNI